jgi:integrase
MPEWSDEAKPYPLTWDEQRRLFQELPAHLAEMALFAVNTGAREGIVCGLRWEWQVRVPELDTSVFIAPGSHIKNGTDCLIVLNGTARAVIEARRGHHPEFVFTYRGHPVDRMNNSAWRRAWRAAELPTGKTVLSGPHNLRHTFARRLRLTGVPLETRKALLHHLDGDITIHYSPAELRELIDAVDRLGEAQRMTVLRKVR